jgi:hypothetical protein
MDAIRNILLSEALGSLREAKSQLQHELAQRPEYQALLIVDRATAQLAGVLDPAGGSLPPASGNGETDGSSESSATIEVREAAAETLPDQESIVEKEPLIEAHEQSGHPADFACALGRSEDPIAVAPAPSPAMSDEAARTTARAIDRFLSSTAQGAVPPTPTARPRSYLPFVVRWPQGNSVAAN